MIDTNLQITEEINTGSIRNVNSNDIIPYFEDDKNRHLQLKYDLNSSLVIFINPKSGNKEGEIILEIASKYKTKEGYKLIDFSKIEKNETILERKYEFIMSIYFNIIIEEELNKGIECIREYIKSIQHGEVVKILIAGGDGSVLSIIQNLNNKNVDINKCIFGHIPLGTGNDLSNALGFNNHINISNNINSLYKILLKYHKAMSGKVDIWKMELKLDDNNGEIIENSKEGKKILKVTYLNKSFINYLSLGYDARVGFNFDKKRTTNRCCNKLVYFWEGLKKNCCRKTLSVDGFLESFSIYEDTEQSFNEQTFTSQIEEEDNLKIKFKFKPKNELSKIDNGKKCFVLKGQPCSIICQNINFYMAGVNNIWKNSKNNLAIDIIENDKNKKEELLKKIKKMINAEQKIDDRKLEFFTYDNGFETGIEKIFGGMAKKLYHGCGPVLIKFKDISIINNDDKKDRIYLNIDGEYFNIVKPIYMKIYLDKSLCNGQLPFLFNISYEKKKK